MISFRFMYILYWHTYVKLLILIINRLLKVISDAHTCPAKIRATVVLIARNIIQKHCYIIEKDDVVNS